MNKPLITVIMNIPSTLSTSRILFMPAIFTAIILQIPIGEYLARNTVISKL